jgi:hypothetical protein
MAPATISLPPSVEGETYRDLVRFAQFEKHTFTLVERHKLKVGPSSRDLLEKLRCCLLTEERVSEWPATRLDAVQATLRRYKLNAVSAGILLAATESLYGWTQSGLFEDLAFWNKRGNWWLATVAHERMGYLRPEHMDLARLSAAVPGLDLS